MAGEINWLEFRAEVAKSMLPIIYKELSPNSNKYPGRDREAAIRSAEIALLLERELRK